MPPSLPARHTPLVTALVGAALLASGQAYLVARAAGEVGYLRGAIQWDGRLYAHIAEHGYRATVPPDGADLDHMNVVFFPGYPLWGRAVAEGLGVSTAVGLVLASWGAAWVGWTYLLLLLLRTTGDARAASWGIVLVALHPACFYLAVAYSESLFLAALLGFFYWWNRGGAWGWMLAAMHGVVLSATRIAGLPVVFYPVFDALVFGSVLGAAAGEQPKDAIAGSRRWSAAALRLLPCGVAALGGLAFFGYCQFRFGEWDLYMAGQRAGWGVQADWLALLRPKNYFFVASLLTPKAPWTDDLSRLAALAMVAAFCGAACVEFRLWRAGHRRDLPGRVALYACALGIFFIHAAGVSELNMRSMLRYSLVPHVLLVLAGGQLAARYGRNGKAGPWLRAGMLVLAAAALALQIALAWRFTHGLWVA